MDIKVFKSKFRSYTQSAVNGFYDGFGYNDESEKTAELFEDMLVEVSANKELMKLLYREYLKK